jgi:hypothetical protein
MTDKIKKLKGANMDIDLATPQGDIAWQQDGCLWNLAENTNAHKCALKNISICPYFCGVEYIDRCYLLSNRIPIEITQVIPPAVSIYLLPQRSM